MAYCWLVVCTPWGLVEVCRNFSGICCLHGGSRFVWDIGTHIPDYTASYHIKQQSPQPPQGKSQILRMVTLVTTWFLGEFRLSHRLRCFTKLNRRILYYVHISVSDCSTLTRKSTRYRNTWRSTRRSWQEMRRRWWTLQGNKIHCL